MKEKEKFIIGKKVGMTQVFNENGDRVAVTVIEAGPCVVVQKKTVETDGYNALQIGYGEIKEKKVTKPLKGHLAAHKIEKNVKVLKEIRVDDIDKYNEGDEILVNTFAPNDVVDVKATSIGKGFAGTVKRWNFTIGPKAHGSKNHRKPGSIGAGTYPGRVWKGKKMAGQMGNETVTVQNLEVIKVIEDDNLILVKGSVPGKKDSIVTLTA